MKTKVLSIIAVAVLATSTYVWASAKTDCIAAANNAHKAALDVCKTKTGAAKAACIASANSAHAAAINTCATLE